MNKKTLHERLLAQAERSLEAIEKAHSPASAKELGGLLRVVERARNELEFERVRKLTTD